MDFCPILEIFKGWGTYKKLFRLISYKYFDAKMAFKNF